MDEIDIHENDKKLNDKLISRGKITFFTNWIHLLQEIGKHVCSEIFFYFVALFISHSWECLIDPRYLSWLLYLLDDLKNLST